MDIKVYHTLHEDAVMIRETVFMKEQGFHDEFDETDRSAAHLVLYIDGLPAATCRFFSSQSQGEYIVGRIAVRKEYRGHRLGSRILSAAESEIRKAGGGKVLLHAQQQARPFYEKQGYCAYGEQDFDEGCPHIWMRKELPQDQIKL
ncbi:MAG TPA: GNAT family N-acetyltransferase [Candidatus Mediterraneibacter stercoravium]|uniref:GNAT family N-acetyltransferase n=1 Tax=Candidatus Mediterraneibacter stercoravium TaxID=2838685 RepID=A0A9D2K2R0_9FIRM|nr:GNAT family N-acetyltransferase [Candidatus Mediterraneibacter stercoravium]